MGSGRLRGREGGRKSENVAAHLRESEAIPANLHHTWQRHHRATGRLSEVHCRAYPRPTTLPPPSGTWWYRAAYLSGLLVKILGLWLLGALGKVRLLLQLHCLDGATGREELGQALLPRSEGSRASTPTGSSEPPDTHNGQEGLEPGSIQPRGPTCPSLTSSQDNAEADVSSCDGRQGLSMSLTSDDN